MPYREHLFLPEQYYHIYNRGNNRQAIFFERDNYLYFLKQLKHYVRPVLDILAYCLMPTHYHILAQVRAQPAHEEMTEKAISLTISRAMQKHSISYTKAINQRFDRVGALFQGQFKGKPIEAGGHLQQVCLYIHANPVKDGLAPSPEDWEFSNYQDWIGLREGTLLNRAFITTWIESPEAYRALMKEYLKTSDVFAG
mgnify:CR=1 FL=1